MLNDEIREFKINDTFHLRFEELKEQFYKSDLK